MYMLGGRGTQSSRLYRVTSTEIEELPLLPFQFEGPMCQRNGFTLLLACFVTTMRKLTTVIMTKMFTHVLASLRRALVGRFEAAVAIII